MASEVREIHDAKEILGTPYDRTTRSLIAALESMSTEDAKKCAQSLVNRLLARSRSRGTEGMSEDAECLLSGLITFSADVQDDAGELSAMHQYFVGHWWSFLQQVLPPPLPEVQMGSTGASASGWCRDGR